MNRSDSSGVVLMRLNIRQPPGLYTIVFDVLPGDSQVRVASMKPANLSLQVHGCIVGEVTPAPDACQACPEGSFSLNPSSGTCKDCCTTARLARSALAALPLCHCLACGTQHHSQPRCIGEQRQRTLKTRCIQYDMPCYHNMVGS
jgi:hypothetical protein